MFTSSEFYTEAQDEIEYEVQKIAHDYKLTNVYIIDMNISWSWNVAGGSAHQITVQSMAAM